MKQVKSDTAWYGLGLTYHDRGDLHAAIGPYRKALLISPDHLDALYNLALVHVVLGQFDDAQPLLEHATSVSANSFDVLTLTGHNYYFRNNLSMARIFYSEALKLDPTSTLAFNYLTFIEGRSGNVTKSEYYWQEAQKSGETIGELYLSRARLESLARKKNSSLMYLSQAIEAGIKKPEKIFSDGDLEFIRDTNEFIIIKESLKK